MYKHELTNQVAQATGMSKAAVENCIDEIMNVIADTLAKKEAVALVGFGTFAVSHRAARNGRSPRTGEVMKIPEQDVPIFKASKNLKEKVRG